ncbi:MAG: twin-arginine translocase TatA/TatE family subunit [Deltaproteobacteria bacterium]|nr:twin-arginine translocase TatA/TatE family subunit [Deltaproteobacteria bacterium]
MFGIGTQEMIVIVVIALIIIGPKQLPEVARMLGKGMAVLRKARDDLTGELRESIDLESHVSSFRSDIEKYIEDEDEPLEADDSTEEGGRKDDETGAPADQPEEVADEDVAHRAEEGDTSDVRTATPREERPAEKEKTDTSAATEGGKSAGESLDG